MFSSKIFIQHLVPYIGSFYQMPVRDGHWNSNAAVFSPQMHGGQAVMPFSQSGQAPTSGKVRGPMTVQTSKKSVVRSGCSGNGSMKPGSDIIEIRATDKLIKEVY